MKVWLWAMLGLLIFIVGAVWVQGYLEKTSSYLDQLAGSVESRLKAGKWDESARKLEIMNQSWQKTKSIWSVLLRHREVDEIEHALSRTERAITSRNFELAWPEIGSLRQLLRQIPERERLNPVNVL